MNSFRRRSLGFVAVLDRTVNVKSNACRPPHQRPGSGNLRQDRGTVEGYQIGFSLVGRRRKTYDKGKVSRVLYQVTRWHSGHIINANTFRSQQSESCLPRIAMPFANGLALLGIIVTKRRPKTLPNWHAHSCLLSGLELASYYAPHGAK